MFTRWFEFLSFYVDRTVPKVNPLVRFGAPGLFEDMFGVAGLGFEPNRFLIPFTNTPIHGDFAGSLAAYEAEPEVRLLFEVGASPDFPADPQAPRQRFEMSFPSWPPPAAEADDLVLRCRRHPDGHPGHRDRHRPVLPRRRCSRHHLEAERPAHPEHVEDHRRRDGPGLRDRPARRRPRPGRLRTRRPVVPLRPAATPPSRWCSRRSTQTPTRPTRCRPRRSGSSTGCCVPAIRPSTPTAATGTHVDHLFYAADYQPLAGEWRNIQIPVYASAHAFRAGKPAADRDQHRRGRCTHLVLRVTRLRRHHPRCRLGWTASLVAGASSRRRRHPRRVRGPGQPATL